MGSKILFDWENPLVIQKNKEPGHVLALPYNDIESALQNNSSPWKISLNGKWKFNWSPRPADRPADFYETEYSVDGWDEIIVPKVWQLQGYDKPYYLAAFYPPPLSERKSKIPKIDHNSNPVGSYRRTFTIPKKWNDREIFIHFGAVKSAFYLWINGKEAGYSQGSMTPAEFNITEYIQEGENICAVEVYRYSDGTYLEDQDMWFLSGIYRDVYIYGEPKVFIRDFFARSAMDSSYSNSEVKVDVYIKNFLDEDTDIAIEFQIIDNDTTRSIIADQSAASAISAGNEEIISLSASVKNPEKWTAETPNLYDLVLILKGKSGTILETKAIKYGFKTVEIKDEQILVNGKPILIKGVNRHDFDPDNAWTVPDERYHQDISIMKKHNINSIRCSHYPNDQRLYEHTDRYGIYVMDEGDMETHGVRDKNVPGSNPVWTKAVVDRAERMVLMNRNHPSIIIWSLGNEAGQGSNFNEMKKAVLALDDTRPIHYEGDNDLEVTDMASQMYPSMELLDAVGNHEPFPLKWYEKLLRKVGYLNNKEYRVERYTGKPFIICEFAHAMGNSLGNFNEYTDRFEKYKNFAGGYIWDFVDQSLRFYDNDGKEKWLYGGDFGEEKTHWYFCANGIIFSDRSLHPSIYEVKKCYQEIKTAPVDIASGKFLISNTYTFIGLSNLELRWEISEEGIPVNTGLISELSINAGESKEISLPYSIGEQKEGKEYHVTITFHLKERKVWAEAGYELAWEQFEIPQTTEKPEKGKISPNKETAELHLAETRNTILVTGKSFSLTIGKKSGGIESLDFGDGELIRSPLIPNLWRAETDNDREFANFFPQYSFILLDKSWEKASKKRYVKKISITEAGGNIIITVHSKVRYTKGKLVTEYTISGDGTIGIENIITPTRDMARFGMQMSLSNRFNNLTWFGKGFHETHIDRKMGAKTGRYSGTVDQVIHNYMRPQENGNRTDVRWASLTDDTGKGIYITDSGGTLLNVSLWPWSQDDLNRSEHIHELPEGDSVTFNIDYKQRGVGGDIPARLSLHEKYKLHKRREYRYSFLLQQFKEENR